jgi:cobalt-zinc-cadmium efflux system membrane fusion protein
MKTPQFIPVLLGFLLGAGCHGEKKAAPGTAGAQVDGDRIVLPSGSAQMNSLAVEEVALRRTNTILLTGRLVWNDEATVRIFSPVGGRVDTLAVNQGQVVAAGDVLARIVSPDFGQAQSDVRKSTADLQLAQRNLARLKTLLEHGATAQKEVEAAEDAYVSAQSERERAAARLALYGGGADVVDQVYSLKAPIAGVVVEKNLNPGQEVRPDQMLGNVPQVFSPQFVISDPTRLWLLLDATELDLPKLKPGQTLQLRSQAYPGRRFEGRIELIGDALDPATRAVKVRASVPNPEKLLKAEMYVTAEIYSDASATIEIPAKAVFHKESKAFVFVENSPGSYERKAVALGQENDGKIGVLEGLREAQRIVTEGCLLLQTVMESGGKL